MRVGVLDIGSNSVRLLVAEHSDGEIVPISRKIATTRLGKNTEGDKILAKDSMKDTIDVIKFFQSQAIKMECDILWPIATSAVREAKNQDEFLDAVFKNTGLTITVLSGKEEADFSFLGAKYGLNIKGAAVVIDVGGGSTEISSGNDDIHHAQSFPIGAVRITQNHLISDPPLADEIKKASREISKETKKVNLILNNLKEKATFIGVGGTFTSLAAILQGLEIYDSKKIHGFEINTLELKHIFKELSSVKLEERETIPGLLPERADIIIGGTLIAINLLEAFDIPRLTISESDLMEGYIYSKMHIGN